MAQGLRQVELIEDGVDGSAADKQQIDHVVGVDESGNTAEDPLVVVAVQCPRSSGETLAELLIDLGLEPWKSKSNYRPEGVSKDELSARVRTLTDELQDLPITWHAAAGWGTYNKEQHAMTACIVSSKAMTGGSTGDVPEYEGAATLMHDGGGQFYGSGQLAIRRAASRQFNGFADRITPVYLSFLKKGDRTYPEITAADYIAGYLNSEITTNGIEGVDCPVDRIDNSWRASSKSQPWPMYKIRTRRYNAPSEREIRAASWIEGRQPPMEAGWSEAPLKALANRLESATVRDYILEEL